MECAPVRSIIPSLKLGDYLPVRAHKPCSISHILLYFLVCVSPSVHHHSIGRVVPCDFGLFLGIFSFILYEIAILRPSRFFRGIGGGEILIFSC